MHETLLQLFPLERRSFWKEVSKDTPCIQEIRLRAGLPILIIREGKEYYLDSQGDYTDKPSRAYLATGREIQDILQHICHYSLYAFEDEIRQGFITVSGGHRIGVAGQAVLEPNGGIRTIKHITYINIRVSHQIKGTADQALPYLYRKGRLKSTLIVSPPGCGKTTLLRDLIRQVSNGNPYGEGKCVGVVDERSEIAGCFMGIPQNDVGMRTDVLDACPKASGMMLLLRAMAPAVIAIDELGGKADMEAVRLAASCGCRILATIHGDSLEDIRIKDGMDNLFQEQLFECFILLAKQDGKCIIKTVYGKEKAYVPDNGFLDDNGWLSGPGLLVPPAIPSKASPSPYSESRHGNDDK
jgi:stage III sporulation protein AA